MNSDSIRRLGIVTIIRERRPPGAFLFELLVAGRHLRAMRGRRQISVTALIAVSGVAIGVAALVIVLSVFNGFTEKLWNSLLGTHPHITVRKAQGQPVYEFAPLIQMLRSQTGVVGAAPYLEADGFLLRRPPSGGLVQTGARVVGIDPGALATVSDIGDHIWGGKVDLSRQPSEGRGIVYGIVVGTYLADQLGVVAGTEVYLGLIPPEILVGQPPQYRKYVVTGIFNTGLEALDAALAYVPLEALQRDLGRPGQISGVHLRVSDAFQAESTAASLGAPVHEIDGDLRVVTWMDTHQNLYASVRMEKWYSFLVLSLIVLVAGFNIISILTMTVAERKREIGILKTLGATPDRISRIFKLDGLAIGLSGVALGTGVAFVLCWVQQRYEPIKLPGSVYIIQALPVSTYASDFLAIGVASVLLCYAFAWLPARDAAGLDPIEAIRS